MRAGNQTGRLEPVLVYSPQRAMKEGKLKSGRSGKKVTNPKQAVAIGLSEARKAGAKVPAKQ